MKEKVKLTKKGKNRNIDRIFRLGYKRKKHTSNKINSMLFVTPLYNNGRQRILQLNDPLTYVLDEVM